MIRVAVDAMGSDRGARAVIEGAQQAAADGVQPVIFGSEELDTGGLALVPTTQVVGMDEKPADAFRTKEDSSLVRAVKAVADGEADAVVSPGNAEGRDILEGAADVLVTDGFTGNVALKSVEGSIRTLLQLLREEITASTSGTLGGFLIKPAARRLRRRLDPDTYGGAYLLGLRGLVVIAHGNSSATAIANAIRLAARGVDHDVVGRLAGRLAEPQRAELV